MGVHASAAVNRAITHSHYLTIEFNFCSPSEAGQDLAHRLP